MEENTQENIKTIRNMVMVYSNGLTVENTVVNGKMVNNMEEENTLIKQVQ